MQQPVEYSATGGSFLRIAVAIAALTVGIGIVIASTERYKIMEQWPERRCDVLNMMSAFLYKPADYPGSAAQFATENFNFCLSRLAKDSLKTATVPVVGMLKKQVDAQGAITTTQNRIRSSLATTVDRVDNKLSFFYEKYKQGIYLFSRIGQGISSAFGRIGGMFIAIVYAIASAFAGMLNGFDFTIYVSTVALGILTAIPFSLLLFGWMTVPALAAVDRYRSSPAYCFARGTAIPLKDGRHLPIQQLEIGMELMDGALVEGIMQFNGTDVQLYNLNDVIVSGTHLVYHGAAVCEVSKHPDARRINAIQHTLFCLITSNRIINTISPNGQITKFADWEEVDGAADEAYDQQIRQMLKFSHNKSRTLPTGLRGSMPVITKENGLQLLSGVKIGEFIADAGDTYTEVKGICVRTVGVANSASDHTDGVIYYDFARPGWDYMGGGMTAGDTSVDIYQLFTSSGTFAIFNFNDMQHTIIRDASEVGIDRIERLTPLVVEQLGCAEK